MEITSRDHARELIAKVGITVDNVTTEQLEKLHSCIDEKMKASSCFRNSYRMNSDVGRFMKCSADYFEDREAVSFNGDGFIGFAGWADDRNIVPVLDGVGCWLDLINGA